ncbi:MAG: thiamine pyrophosphate-binding protein [Curvibacter sp.]|nr:thiamine pyrophosphate-binding protein [Curvibacter sp.]
MRVADYVMTRLHQEGVRQIFMVTGRGALFLTDAVAKHPGIEGVSVHHEQAASFAAVAYADQSDGVGACLVSTGCASTNAVTGVLSAWQDGIPLVVISGQNTLKETTRFTGVPIRTYGQQEADIIAIVKPITKYAVMLTRPEDIVGVMDEATRLAVEGRKGPVWIDIPLDLQSAMIDVPESTSAGVANSRAAVGDVSAGVEAIQRLLSGAKRPVMLLGRGVRSAGADRELREFVERTRIPVTFAASAVDTLGAAEPLAIGSVGSMGCSRAGNFAVQNADLVIVLGSRLSSITTGTDFCKFARAAKIVVVDLDRVEHSKESVRIDEFIQADLKLLLAALNQRVDYAADNWWIEKCLHWKDRFSAVESPFLSHERVDLYQLASSLSTLLPVPCAVVTDSGLIEVILPTNIRFRPGQRCIHPVSQGTMGFALPAAIGAHYASMQPVIAVIGDGSIMMNLQELETIRYRQLPIKVLVVNNDAYSIIRRRQVELFRKRTIGTDPANGVSVPDFAHVADCFGFQYRKIESVADLEAGLQAVFNLDGPVICEIMGRTDQGYIELSQTRSVVDRRMVRRPLEDQAPFLDREVFQQEMVIDPIDQ